MFGLGLRVVASTHNEVGNGPQDFFHKSGARYGTSVQTLHSAGYMTASYHAVKTYITTQLHPTISSFSKNIKCRCQQCNEMQQTQNVKGSHYANAIDTCLLRKEKKIDAKYDEER
jgi:hypothetical protein